MQTVVRCALGPILTLLLLAGCSSGGGNSAAQTNPNPPQPATTAVTLMLSSSADDELTEFDVQLVSVSLSNAAGKQVSVLSQTRAPEFVHVNGTNEPLLTAQLPQDTYTGATVTVGSADFVCLTLDPGSTIDVSEFAYGQTPTADVTVTLPAPIVVSRAPLGLTLALSVSKSASYDLCGATFTFAITPTFTLSAFAYSPLPGAAASAAVVALDGQVSALDADSMGFAITLPSEASVHVSVGGATAWQGITALTDLKAGTFVDLDGTVQQDGSVAATRVAVADPAAVDVLRGTLFYVSNAAPTFEMQSREAQGPDHRSDSEILDLSSTTFAVSGALASLHSLPFAATFTAQNMVPGQVVAVTTPAFAYARTYVAAANTVTLMPQTINGKVTGVSMSGDFTVYSVALGTYDAFPAFATVEGQTTLLTNPGVVEVYTDTATAMLTAAAPAPGDTLRFSGLVFNDQGTLRMDCAQVSPGVTQLSETTNPLISAVRPPGHEPALGPH